MKNKNVILLFIRIMLFVLFVFAFLVSCSETDTSPSPREPQDNKEHNKEQTQADTQVPSDTDETSAEKDYILFTLNYNDWTFPDKSIAALEKVIEIHEKYNVPVDIYISDPTFQNLMTMAPDVVEKLKTSSVVAVSYHIRPPMPAYKNFDFLGLEEMSDQERYETLLSYEEHKLDLETGMPILDKPGGYQYLKEIIGYAPITVGIQGVGLIATTMKKIYAEKGATFMVKHTGDLDSDSATTKNFKLGEKDGALFIRPEDIAFKWYEYANMYGTDEKAAGKVIEDAILAEDQKDTSLFINIKMHENNFFSEGNAAMWDVYGKDHKPPFDLSAAYEHAFMTDQEIEDQWIFYESAVAYVAHHPEQYTAINSFDLKEMIEI